MPRLLARLSILALSATALAACATDTAGTAAPKPDTAKADSQPMVPTSLEATVRDAQLKRVQGDYAGAVRILSQAMLAAPDDPRVVGEYGKVLVQQGRSQEAVDFLARAVQLNSVDWTLYSALGVAYDQLNKPADARVAYERALILKPGEAVVLNNYAMSRMLAGDLAQARRLIAQAAAGSADPQIKRNVDLIASLTAQETKQADAQPPSPPVPVTVKPLAPVAKPALAAMHPARATTTGVATSTTSPTIHGTAADGPPKNIVVQAVPFDPKAGKVAEAQVKAKKPLHKPAKAPIVRKLAKAAPATKTAAAKPAAPKPVATQIPALRLANDGQ
jgi:Flp pilus assembly protein TadD